MTPVILYHVTDLCHKAEILKGNCLRPFLGENSLPCEDKPAVYLCAREDVPMWMRILGKETVLKIGVPQSTELTETEYSGYREYWCEHAIYPIDICDVTDTITAKELEHANERICCEYLWALNRLCLQWIQYKEKDVVLPYSYLANATGTFLKVMNRQDYGNVPRACLEREMAEMEDSCCYAFTDCYGNTGKRLWERLAEYPDDGDGNLERTLNTFVRKNLMDIAYWNTGGYQPMERERGE